MKNLENLGVQELNTNEIISIDGGFPGWYVWEEVISYAASEFAEGFIEGFTSAANTIVESHNNMYH